MFILVPFLLLFMIMGLLWVAAAGWLAGALIVRAPHALEKMLDHGEKNCACYFGMKHHHGA